MRLAPFSFLLALAACAGGDKGTAEGEGLFEGDLVDDDRDGFFTDTDCNDADGAVNSGAAEICDGVDNNCDGEVDEGVTSEWYEDADEDGFGDAEGLAETCSPPAGFVSNGSDCDDSDDAVYPGAYDVCDGIDNNCDGEADEDDALLWYADGDGDTWGDDGATLLTCAPPEGYVAEGGDCDDDEPEVFPGHVEVCDELDNDCDGSVDEGVTLVFYEDRDDDGWGLLDSTTEACAAPVGYAEDGGDCNDDDTAYYPGAPESDCTDPNDYNCDGSVGYADDDLDNYAACQDCNDADAAINPDATEVCDRIDNDCNGDVDDDDSGVDLSTGSVFYADSDSDAYGDPGVMLTACELPAGYSTDLTDCDDGDSHINPAATEVCNSKDDDCDTLIDDADSSVDLGTGLDWYGDADADGYGASSVVVTTCDQPAGYVGDDSDCDDSDHDINPAALEVCDSLDNDCDTLVDDADPGLDTSTGDVFYSDVDGDGYGWSSATVEACLVPAGYVANDDDCNDSARPINPAATEICDSVDNDCDLQIDDADSSLDKSTGATWYRDADTDAYGSPTVTTQACLQPSGYLSVAGDCNDGVAAINPAASEICDTLDNDCDAKIDDADTSVDLTTGGTWYRDADTDTYGSPTVTTKACALPSGYVSNASDCNDGAAAINPAAREICDSLDNDCDLAIDDADSSVDVTTGGTWYRDADADAYGSPTVTTKACALPSGYVSTATDCNDAAAAINPAASEICDSLDNDCDTKIDDADSSVDLSTGAAWYRDSDGDAYGLSTSSSRACSKPSGYVANATDCNDSAAAINPAASEVCDSTDNDCDTLVDDADSSLDKSTATTWYPDADTDGYGASSSGTAACSRPAGHLTGGGDCNDSNSSINPAASETCNGTDDDCDGSTDEGLTTASYSMNTTSPSGSCNGNANRYGTITVCGCPTVDIVGAFYDYSDGSSGQVVGVSTGAQSFALTWDDCSSGCDCDLDIAASTSWSASKSGTTLTVTVSSSVTGYSAGNSLGAGYTITSYGTYLDSGTTRTFTYACSY
jgi:hypothetical protein